MNVKC